MKALFTSVSIVFLLTLTGCKKEEVKPTEATRVSDLLTRGTGTWSPSATLGVTVDGVDVTKELFQ